MKYCEDTEPIRILYPDQLQIPSLQLFGHARFHKTFAALSSHSHSGLEFIAVLKGTQQYEVAGQCYTLQGGDIFMTVPEELHSNGNMPQEVAEIVWFQLDSSKAEHFLGLMEPYGRYVHEQIFRLQQTIPQKRILHVLPQTLYKLRDAFELLNCCDTGKQAQGYLLLLEFITATLCNWSETDPAGKQPPVSGEISAALEYIHTHLTENPSLEDIAEHCGMSFSIFNIRFKEQMGMTPHAYMLTCKVNAGKELLKNPSVKITDIAYQLNFASSDYFSTVFKKYTGYTPTEYRYLYYNKGV